MLNLIMSDLSAPWDTIIGIHDNAILVETNDKTLGNQTVSAIIVQGREGLSTKAELEFRVNFVA